MRVLILTLILLVPLSSNSLAMSNGDLYQYCKPYADRVFEYKESTDLICASYFRGVADSGMGTCSAIKEIIATLPLTPGQKAILRIAMSAEGLVFADGSQIKPAIQIFVNEMATSPERWDSNPVMAVHNSLKKIVPCE